MGSKTITVMIIIVSILLALFALAGWFACRQTPGPQLPEPTPAVVEPTPVPAPDVTEVSGIRLLLESYEMHTGDRFYPEVIIQPHNATDKSYELSSSDERVVRRQGNSWIASAVGTARLTATASNGMTTYLTVTVLSPRLESLSFVNNEITMQLDDQTGVVLVQTPRNAVENDKIRYASDNERIATISNEGRITAVGVGTTFITASSGNIRAEMRVNVVIPIRKILITVDRASLAYSVDEQVEFMVQVEPESASLESISLEFTGAHITSTGSYTFRWIEAGKVTIKGTSEGGVSGDVTINVFDLDELADEVFRITNLERSSRGLPVLGRLTNLTNVAQLRAGEIIIRTDHTRPDGRQWHTILDDYGITDANSGENIAAGQLNPAEAVRAWMESAGHRANILGENITFRYLGIGVTMDNTGRLYWLQLFTD